MKSNLPASLRVIGRSIVDWWDGWLDMVIVMILWVIAQVTIILGPPATFGLYHVVHEMVNGQATGARGLIAGGRQFFWKAWLWWLINIVVMITIVVNYIFYGGFDATWSMVVQIVILMIGFLWFCTQFYAIPYYMVLEVPSLKTAMRNGILTTLAAPFFTFVLMLLVVVILALSFGFVIPLFLGLPAVVPFLGFRAMQNRLEAFGLREPEKTPKELEYEEGGKMRIPELEDEADDTLPPDVEVTDGKGQVKQG